MSRGLIHRKHMHMNLPIMNSMTFQPSNSMLQVAKRSRRFSKQMIHSERAHSERTRTHLLSPIWLIQPKSLWVKGITILFSKSLPEVIWQSCQAVNTTQGLTKKAFRAYLVTRVHAAGVCNQLNASLAWEYGSQSSETTILKLCMIKCAQVISSQSSWSV